MKKYQLPKTLYLQEHLYWLKGAMSYLDGDDEKDNELGRYELEHAVWLLKKVQRLDIEAAHPMTWYKYVGLDGDVIGIEKFGASAPADVVFKEYGFTAENVVARAKALLG